MEVAGPLSLIADSAVRSAMGGAARRPAAKLFSAERIVARDDELYARVCGQPAISDRQCGP